MSINDSELSSKSCSASEGPVASLFVTRVLSGAEESVVGLSRGCGPRVTLLEWGCCVRVNKQVSVASSL